MIDDKRLQSIMNSLPPISPAVNKVIELANTMGTSALELSAAIKIDPVLMTKVLKLINSAYFGMRTEVTSLNRAIILLGVNTIKNLALSTALISGFADRTAKSGLNIEELWMHSLAVAVASKMLAKYVGVEKKYVESFFIAGLIHDIGKLLFDQYKPVKYKMLLFKIARSGGTLFKEETKLFGYNHGNLGALLCEKWNIGDEITESIRNSHSVGDSPQSKMGAIVQTADAFVNRSPELPKLIGGNTEYNESNFLILDIDEPALDSIFSSLSSEIESATIFIKKV